MPEHQEDIDALLSEVSALADEAIADISGEESAPGPEGSPDTSATAAEPPQTSQTEPAATTSEPPAPAVPSEPPPVSPPTLGAPDIPATPRAREDPARVLHLQVPVIVQLAERTMPLSEIITLTTGAIIEFDKPSDGQLDLMINNKCIGQGQAVKVGENFGLRVANVGSVRERIKAMGE